jgi:hypothetical protein
VSEPDDVPDIHVPSDLRAGVYADHIDVYGDFIELTIDFARLDPRRPTRGDLVARVALSRWCILKLQEEFARRVE